MGHAEPPSPLVIGGYVRNGIGLFWQAMEVFLQFVEGHLPVYRFGIADYVQVVLGEVDDSSTRGVFDPGFINAPFLRDLPVHRLRSSGDLVNLHAWDATLKSVQRLPDAVAGKTTANGKELLYEAI
jgi:hypothetical protein